MRQMPALQKTVNHLIRSEIQILGSFGYTSEDFREALEWITSGKVNGEGWTEVRPLSGGGRAFADLAAGKVTNGKIILDPNR